MLRDLVNLWLDLDQMEVFTILTANSFVRARDTDDYKGSRSEVSDHFTVSKNM
jgi:hypothetical protein